MQPALFGRQLCLAGPLPIDYPHFPTDANMQTGWRLVGVYAGEGGIDKAAADIGAVVGATNKEQGVEEVLVSTSTLKQFTDQNAARIDHDYDPTRSMAHEVILFGEPLARDRARDRLLTRMVTAFQVCICAASPQSIEGYYHAVPSDWVPHLNHWMRAIFITLVIGHGAAIRTQADVEKTFSAENEAAFHQTLFSTVEDQLRHGAKPDFLWDFYGYSESDKSAFQIPRSDWFREWRLYHQQVDTTRPTRETLGERPKYSLALKTGWRVRLTYATWVSGVTPDLILFGEKDVRIGQREVDNVIDDALPEMCLGEQLWLTCPSNMSNGNWGIFDHREGCLILHPDWTIGYEVKVDCVLNSPWTAIKDEEQ